MKRSPLYEEHLNLGARMIEYCGWEMPLSYQPGTIAEHLATRKYGGLFDISHMGRFLITGRDAIPFMQYVLTSNVAALAPGQSQYTIIANESGGAVDDAYLYRVNEKEYLLVVNAANSEKDRAWLQKYDYKFPDLVLEDLTARIAMLSLQGPRAKAILEILTGDMRKLPEPLRNRLTSIEMLGTTVLISRTGYTGEPVCFELFPPADIVVKLWKKLLELGGEEGIIPVGLGARETLRVEAGLPLYGHELGIDTEGKEIPVFALPVATIAVSFSEIKGEFIGREVLIKQSGEVKSRQEGCLEKQDEQLLVPREIMPLSISGIDVPCAGCQVYADDVPVGNITSGNVVPYWKVVGTGLESRPGAESGSRTCCLAYLDTGLKKGQKIRVASGDGTAEGVIVERNISSEAAPYARPMIIEEQETLKQAEPDISLENLARSLVRKTCSNDVWRQRSTVNLIPSEQTLSPIVKLLMITDPSGRYAEHRKVKALENAEIYYYQGTGFIAEVELELARQIKKYLGCSQVETRLISGQMANITVFSGIADYLNRMDRHREPRRLRSVMNHHIGRGGHLSAQVMGGLRDYVSVDPVTEKRAVVNFPISMDNPYIVDIARTADLVERHKPELIILGKSMILHREPVAEMARIIAGVKPRPVLMYDGAHVLGLFGPYFQEPLQEGADIITASTHKTFFGTQRGIIASNISEESGYSDLWESISRRAFPGSVSNHHLGTLLGLLMATYEMNAYGRDYQKQVIANAKAFALALKGQGLQVEGDPGINYTETHQVILRVGYAKGIETARRLENNNIIVNYQGLFDDEAFTTSSGLRMGVQEMTRFGMKEEDFRVLAGYIAAVIQGAKDISQEVSEFREKFTKMQYCLPEEQVRPLVDELIGSIVVS